MFRARRKLQYITIFSCSKAYSVSPIVRKENFSNTAAMGRRKAKWSKGERTHRKGGYPDIVRANEAFEQYYKAQGIIPEGEWDQFVSVLKDNLPATFRITGFKRHAQQLLGFLKSHYFNDLVDVKVEGLTIQKPFPLPWYPDELAWQLNLSRSNIRKIPALEKLHNFLITETESGNISRQESVSMIPPLLLDVQPHHKVFDMCAAPGSKTAQLIEMLHADDNQPWPDGFVLANDADNKRCYIMVHQAKRLNSPCVMIVNQDATVMPVIHVPDDKNEGEVKALKFDRVLCDVPCSADGTLRKNYVVWKKWSVHNGFTLHPLQLQLLTRGVELLEIGGRLVYSTCSFNPIEDEAVVAALLSRSQGALELVDCSKELPNLKRVDGLTSWKVMTETNKVYPNYEEVPLKNRKRIKESMFPPEDVDSLHLDRCIRLLPHHQDTGGFFIAVLQKTKALPWTREGKKSTQTDSEEASSVQEVSEDGKRKSTFKGPPPKRRHFEGYKEDPFIFFEEDEELWPPIRNFFGIPESFPSTQLLIRCETGKKRTIYFVNEAIKQIITNNRNKLKVINSGVRVLCRSNSPEVDCNFRLTQEGSSSLLSYVSNRLVHLTKDDVITLLTEENPFVHKLSTDSRKQITENGQGSLMFVYDPPTDKCPDENRIVIVGWRGRTSVRSFVAKGDRYHILRMCGVDVNLLSERKPKQNKGGGATGGQQSTGEQKDVEDGDNDNDDGGGGGGDGDDDDDEKIEDVPDDDEGVSSKEEEMAEEEMAEKEEDDVVNIKDTEDKISGDEDSVKQENENRDSEQPL